MLFALCFSAEAQQATKRFRASGFLSLNRASVQKDRVEAFREALRKLGYVEGQNIDIDYRYGGQQIRTNAPDSPPSWSTLNVDVMVTTGSSATRPAKEADHYDSDRHDVGQRSGGLGLCH